MADMINLRQARRAKARANTEVVAAQNRINFGQTKAEKTKNKAETALATRKLDGALRDAVGEP